MYTNSRCVGPAPLRIHLLFFFIVFMQKCPCELCGGKLRDRRTIRKHLSSPYERPRGRNPSQDPDTEVSCQSFAQCSSAEDVRSTNKQACFCKDCNCQIRDYRTFRAHLLGESSGFDREFTHGETVVVHSVNESANYQEASPQAGPDNDNAFELEDEPNAELIDDIDDAYEEELDVDPIEDFEPIQDADEQLDDDPIDDADGDRHQN